jgi:hypothetical protein
MVGEVNEVLSTDLVPLGALAVLGLVAPVVKIKKPEDLVLAKRYDVT